MNKGVSNMAHFQDHARAANERYLNALSVVDDPRPAYQRVSDLTESKVHKGRSDRGFNPASRDDIRLFQAVLSGDHMIKSFQNAHNRNWLWGQCRNRTDQRGKTNAVTRLLKRLPVRGLIAKIPRSRRRRTTGRGQKQLSPMIQLQDLGLPMAA